MTDSMTSQNIDLSSWDTLYIYVSLEIHRKCFAPPSKKISFFSHPLRLPILASFIDVALSLCFISLRDVNINIAAAEIFVSIDKQQLIAYSRVPAINKTTYNLAESGC